MGPRVEQMTVWAVGGDEHQCVSLEEIATPVPRQRPERHNSVERMRLDAPKRTKSVWDLAAAMIVAILPAKAS